MASNYELSKVNKQWVVMSIVPRKVIHKYPIADKAKADQALAAIQLQEKKEPKGQ